MTGDLVRDCGKTCTLFGDGEFHPQPGITRRDRDQQEFTGMAESACDLQRRSRICGAWRSKHMDGAPGPTASANGAREAGEENGDHGDRTRQSASGSTWSTGLATTLTTSACRTPAHQPGVLERRLLPSGARSVHARPFRAAQNHPRWQSLAPEGDLRPAGVRPGAVRAAEAERFRRDRLGRSPAIVPPAAGIVQPVEGAVDRPL